MLQRPALGVRPSRAAVAKDLATLARVAWRMTIRKPALAYRFWRLLLSCAYTNPRALEYVVTMIVIFLHVGPFAAHVIADLETQIGGKLFFRRMDSRREDRPPGTLYSVFGTWRSKSRFTCV